MKLLKFPEVDLFEKAIEKSIKGMIEHENAPYYQEIFLSKLYEYYLSYDDSLEIINILSKIEELDFWIQNFHQIDDPD